MASVNAQMTAARRKLPIIPTKALMRELAAWQEETAQRIINKLKVYPAELENQRYIRTYRLRRAWRPTNSTYIPGFGMTLNITNSVTDRQGKRYASLVQGIDQKPIHQGRWLQITAAMQSENGEYRRGIKSILREHGIT